MPGSSSTASISAADAGAPITLRPSRVVTATLIGSARIALDVPSLKKVHVSTVQCPRCGAMFEDHDAWAGAALTSLMVAPAIDDMATQVRCPTCRHLLVESQVRYMRSTGSRVATILIWACIASIFAWAFYSLMRS